MIKGDPFVSSVLERAEQVDIALVGIGAMRSSQVSEMSNITAEERRLIFDKGGVGEILGYYFTLEGKQPANYFH